MTEGMPMKEKGPKVFAVSGIKNSGKTTLIEKLVRRLTARGLRIGVIKHDGHEFEADREGTDSYRHKQAGAENVIVYSKTKLMMIKDQPSPQLETLLSYQQDMDVIILEGMKFSDYPKLEIVRKCISKESVCKKETLLALVTDTALTLEGVKVVALEDEDAILQVVLDYVGATPS